MCDYGGPVAALATRGRLWGAQFHPEKSGTTGLALLANFVGWPGGVMELLPAIDLRGGDGRAPDPGRLRTGGALRRPGRAGGRATSTAGATLDPRGRPRRGAHRRAHERGALSRIVRLASAAGVRVQIGGGIRSEDDAAELLESGVTRVVLGHGRTRGARRWPARCARRWPGRVAVGLDYRVGDDGVAEALGPRLARRVRASR